MSLKSWIVICSMGAVVTFALVACSQQPATTTAATSALQPSAAAGTASAPSSLEVTGWGPDSTKAGTVFNKQPNGGSALWIRVNQSLDGYEATVKFNGETLQGDISDNLVTVSIPASLYATPGTYKVYVVARKGDKTSQSNVVTFTVQ